MISKQLKIAAAAVVASVWITASADAAGTGYIFVSNEMDNTVSVIDGESFEIVKTIPTGQRPRDMRWSIDKTQLLVAVSGDDRIDVIDIASLTVVGTIEAGEDPEIFNLDPSGRIIVAANEDDNQVTIIDIATGKQVRVSK